jgi:very-short-patch-repair endonuclease
LVSRTKLREALAAHGRGRRGARFLAELVEGGRPSSLTRSEAEERLRAMILAAGLPSPQMQAAINGFTADFYWPGVAYAVEFDGFAFHSSRRAWERDRRKDRVFAAAGIRLDRFTWEDVTERSLATIAQIARQLATAQLSPRSAGGSSTRSSVTPPGRTW